MQHLKYNLKQVYLGLCLCLLSTALFADPNDQITGVELYSLGQYKIAIPLLLDQNESALKSNNLKQYIETSFYISDAYNKLSTPNKASSHLLRALNNAQKTSTHLTAQQAFYFNLILGNSARQQNDLKSALKYLKRASRLSSKNSKTSSRLYNDIGLLYIANKKLNKAQAMFKQSKQIALSENDASTTALVSTNQAKLALEINNHENLNMHLMDASHHVMSQTDSIDKIVQLLTLGDLYAEADHNLRTNTNYRSNAFQLYSSSYFLSKGVSDELTGYALGSIGLLYEREKKHKESLIFLSEASIYSQLAHDTAALKKWRQLKNKIQKQQQDLKKPAKLIALHTQLPEAFLTPQNSITLHPKIKILNIKLTGSTLLTQEEVQQTLSPYIHHTVTLKKIYELRAEIHSKYSLKGYKNTKVSLPIQNFNDGNIELTVSEKKITQTKITNKTRLRDNFIKKRIEHHSQEQPRSNDIQHSLQLLQLNPLISNIHSELHTAQNSRDSILNLSIQEPPPFVVSLSANNYRSQSTSSDQAEIYLSNKNLTGFGDALSFSAFISEGLESDTSIAYSIPLNRYDSKIFLEHGESSSTRLIRGSERYEFESKSSHSAIIFSHPIINRVTRKVELKFDLSKNRDENLIDENEQELIQNPNLASSNTSVVDLSTEWTERRSHTFFSFKVNFREGLNTQNAKIVNKNTPDSEFSSVRTQLRFIRTIKGFISGTVDINARIQYTNDLLLPIEKLTLGGRYSIRGLEEKEMLLDSGCIFNFEYQIPIFTQKNNPTLGIKLIPFVDFGQAWNNRIKQEGRLSTNEVKVTSIGLGLKWQAKTWLSSELYYGHTLSYQAQGAHYNTEQNNVHFSATISIPLN